MYINLQDFSTFNWKYDGLKERDDFDITKWREIFRIKSNDYLCDIKWKLQNHVVSFGKFHDLISSYPIPLMTALMSRLTEIGVRTTFLIIMTTTALLFEELNDRVVILAEKSVDIVYHSSSNGTSLIVKDLEKWKLHYDLICQLTDHIDSCFNLVLFLMSVMDYSVAIIELQNIFLDCRNPRYYFQFIHSVLRAFSVFRILHRVKFKVV